MVTTGTAHAETADDDALRDAAWGGKIDEVERLLEKGADPNAPNQNGWTALHSAAEHADARILESLLESGGNPNLQDAKGRTPLILAALFPYDELRSQLAIRILLRFGAQPDLSDNSGRTPLFVVAINHHQPTSARDLLAAGADPNKRAFAGIPPLHAAVGSESKLSADMVQALVDGGARGDIVGTRGQTPLQLFVRVGSNDGRIADALADAGSDVDAKNPDGESPLHTAIRNGSSSENNRVVEALLAAGADPCIKDASGYIPYNTAREGGEVHTMLANAGGSDIGCQGSEAPVADYIVDPADWPGETTARSNIRSGPGTDHDVVRTLDVRKFVHVTGTIRNTDWLEVEVGGSTAFIHASLVREVEPYVTAQASDDAGKEAMESDHIKVATYMQLTCVDPDGELVDLPFEEMLPSLRSGTCAGFLEVERTATCDTRRWSCDLDLDFCNKPELNSEEFNECWFAWVDEPPSFASYEDDAWALAQAARADRSGIRAESEAKWRAQFESPAVLKEKGVGSEEEDEALTAARIEEDAAVEAGNAAQDDASGANTTVASINTEPKCSEIRGVLPWDTVCWWDLTQPSDCLVLLLPYEFDPNSYTNAPEGEELTWSGACERGVANGKGVITWRLGGDTVLASHTGQFVDGVRQGHWEQEFDLHADHYGREHRGPFVDGLRHGDWVERSWGEGDFRQYDLDEGPYVQGKQSGSWLLQHWNQNYGEKVSCNDAEYADGDQVWASPPYWC